MENLLRPDVRRMLTHLRSKRGFDARRYVAAKTRLLNDYMSRSKLSGIVLGVSGGIDSAVVLGLAAAAAKQPGSPIKRIAAVLLPYHIEAGTTNQSEATSRGREVAQAYAADCMLVDLSEAHRALKTAADGAARQVFDGNVGGAWASGQLVSYLRTPALFYMSSLLGEQGFPAIVVGTTNRDEGGYIGYFGKAADAMVDLQLVSDLHKSEVYAVARALSVPQCALDAEPTGDIYDGRTDEQLIGAPYDFIELYQLLLCTPEIAAREALLASLSELGRKQFDLYAHRLEQLNRENSHKYIGATTAVHLDIYERAVPGGWRTELDPDHVRAKLDRSVFVNEFQLSDAVLEKLETSIRAQMDAPGMVASTTTRESLPGFDDSAFILRNVLTGAECAELRAELLGQKWTPVGQNGMLKGFDAATDKVGSYRASHYSERFAKLLWDRIAPVFPSLRVMDEFTPADSDGDPVWRAVGINPLMRFIRYNADGLLVPHYDAPYDYHDGKRTIMSLVLYLTDSLPEDGGATRFILDPQRHLPTRERNHCDWSRLAEPGEILLSVQPAAGSSLVFDHRILHDSDMIRGSAGKIIMRTDVVFERCGLSKSRRITESRPLGKPEGSVLTAGVSVSGTEATGGANLLQRALADPFYGSAYRELKSVDKIVEAGFFDDKATDEDVARRPDAEWLITPLDKIVRRLEAIDSTPAKEGEWLAVLLSTGSYCPVHAGHVEMLEIARREVEARGGTVIGGYMSASHDEYVSAKCGDDALSGAHRVRLVEESVAHSDWIMADGWEALAAERALNFTDVIGRLERYLSRHVRTSRPIHVVYVFGGDNAKFSRTFVARGKAVCIPRPGYETVLQEIAQEPGIRDNPRIMIARECGHDAASSSVRRGKQSLMVGGARALFLQWNANRQQRRTIQVGCYYLRNEGAWAVEPWYSRADKQCLGAAWHRFNLDLAALIRKVHRCAVGPEQRVAVRFRHLDMGLQRKQASALTAGEKVISLDPCIPGDINLSVSRHFPVANGSARPVIKERPGAPRLSEQIAAIPEGEYTLFDDDIASGATMREVARMMPDSVKITRGCALTHRAGKDRPTLVDIVDTRDFLAGARESGLAVVLPDGSAVRAPYALPYVVPSRRASIPHSAERDFSREIWRMNARFHESTGNKVRLCDTTEAFQALMRYVGFGAETSMLDICMWHVEKLT